MKLGSSALDWLPARNPKHQHQRIKVEIVTPDFFIHRLQHHIFKAIDHPDTGTSWTLRLSLKQWPHLPLQTMSHPSIRCITTPQQSLLHNPRIELIPSPLPPSFLGAATSSDLELQVSLSFLRIHHARSINQPLLSLTAGMSHLSFPIFGIRISMVRN